MVAPADVMIALQAACETRKKRKETFDGLVGRLREADERFWGDAAEVRATLQYAIAHGFPWFVCRIWPDRAHDGVVHHMLHLALEHAHLSCLHHIVQVLQWVSMWEAVDFWVDPDAATTLLWRARRNRNGRQFINGLLVEALETLPLYNVRIVLNIARALVDVEAFAATTRLLALIADADLASGAPLWPSGAEAATGFSAASTPRSLARQVAVPLLMEVHRRHSMRGRQHSTFFRKLKFVARFPTMWANLTRDEWFDLISGHLVRCEHSALCSDQRDRRQYETAALHVNVFAECQVRGIAAADMTWYNTFMTKRSGRSVRRHHPDGWRNASIFTRLATIRDGHHLMQLVFERVALERSLHTDVFTYAHLEERSDSWNTVSNALRWGTVDSVRWLVRHDAQLSWFSHVCYTCRTNTHHCALSLALMNPRDDAGELLLYVIAVGRDDTRDQGWNLACRGCELTTSVADICMALHVRWRRDGHAVFLRLVNRLLCGVPALRGVCREMFLYFAHRIMDLHASPHGRTLLQRCREIWAAAEVADLPRAMRSTVCIDSVSVVELLRDAPTARVARMCCEELLYRNRSRVKQPVVLLSTMYRLHAPRHVVDALLCCAPFLNDLCADARARGPMAYGLAASCVLAVVARQEARWRLGGDPLRALTAYQRFEAHAALHWELHRLRHVCGIDMVTPSLAMIDNVGAFLVMVAARSTVGAEVVEAALSHNPNALLLKIDAVAPSSSYAAAAAAAAAATSGTAVRWSSDRIAQAARRVEALVGAFRTLRRMVRRFEAARLREQKRWRRAMVVELSCAPPYYLRRGASVMCGAKYRRTMYPKPVPDVLVRS